MRVRISSSFSVLRPLYFDLFTSTSVLRHFVKSGLLIGRDLQVEVKSVGRSTEKVEDMKMVEVQKRSN